MLLIFLSIQLVVKGLSEATLAPPKHIQVKEGLITWIPATEERGVNYIVQYRSFRAKKWKNVTACYHTAFNSCNISFTEAESENGCVTLRVQAEKHGLTSRPVEACSRHGDACTPKVNLTTRPGSMIVYLDILPSMVHKYGGHIQNRVYYGKEGKSLEKNYKDGTWSVYIHGLEQGSRYCIKAQYLLYSAVLGTDSCVQCELIPESAEPKLKNIIVAVVIVVALAILIPVIVYIFIFHRKKIKLWLHLPYNIPDHFLLAPNINHQLCSPSECECHDVEVRRE